MIKIGLFKYVFEEVARFRFNDDEREGVDVHACMAALLVFTRYSRNT